jgi:hypothetical protein
LGDEIHFVANLRLIESSAISEETGPTKECYMGSTQTAEVRLATAITLREAALALLKRAGKPAEDKREVLFEAHLVEPGGPLIRLPIALFTWSQGAKFVDYCNDKHLNVLNISWIADTLTLITLRRGEWEWELMVMSRVESAID